MLRDYDDLLPLRAGLAVADVVGPSALVKWPNDVWLDGRKVAGILVEARQDPGWAVLGIGVNVAVDPATLPPDAAEVAGHARPEPRRRRADADPSCSRRSSTAWARSRPVTLAALRERDALLGQPVKWQDGEGTGAGIDDDGALRVTLDDGSTTTLVRRRGHASHNATRSRCEGMDLELNGRVAVVTGASKGIGLAVARTLRDEGVHVVATSRTRTPELETSSTSPPT